MKRTIFPFIIIFSFIILLSSSNSTKTSTQNVKWDAIDSLMRVGLPESALEEIHKLQAQMRQDNNIQEEIKAELLSHKIRLEINPDETTQVLKELEDFTYSLEESAEQQLMFCMLAEIYLSYYQNNQYNIDRRTEIQGETPDNTAVWTKNHYTQKVKTLFEEALSKENILKNTALIDLKELIEFSDLYELETLYLYDYLLYKKIEVLESLKDLNEVEDCYKQLIEFRKTLDDKSLLVIAELKYLNYQHKANKLYFNELEKLAKQYQNTEAVVEVYAKIAEYYLEQTSIENNRKKAHQISQKGLKEYPDYKRIGILQNIINQIESKHLTLSGKTQIKAYSELQLQFETKNIEEVQIELYKVNLSATDFFLYELNKRVQPNTEITEKDLLNKQTIKINLSENFDYTSTDYQLNTSDYGIYEVRVFDAKDTSADSKFTVFHFTTTDLSYIKKDISAEKSMYYVVDRISGKPLKNVEIEVYEYAYKHSKYELNQLESAKTDSKGKVIVKRNMPYSEIVIQLKNKADSYFMHGSFTSYYREGRNPERAVEQINLFTDRALYRPGQTLYFKAIATYLSKDEQKVLPNKTINIELMDANGKIIQTKKLISNEFGSVAGEFILPNSGLNGYYSLRANNQLNRFRVEEYKRPSFEVEMKTITEEIKFGKELQLEGEAKAYSGHSIPNASIHYIIKRQTHPFLRWHIPFRGEELIESGSITSDAKGKFTICFTPEKDNEEDTKFKQAYYYIIETTVTDSKGETQEAQLRVAVGEQAVFIHANIPTKIDKNKDIKLAIHTQNLNGENLDKEIEYQIVSIKETEAYNENINIKDLKEKALIEESIYHTKDAILKVDFSKYPSGRYKIKLSTKDDDGKRIESEHIFILYSAKDKKPAIKSYTWTSEKNNQAEVGEKVEVQFGTSVKNAKILMEVMHGKNIISSKWINFNNRTKRFKVRLSERYRDGLSLSFTFVRDEQMFTEVFRITEKPKTKELTPKLSSFRDKLVPGEEVKWTLHIPEASANDKIVELLASMYDASLDVIEAHGWFFNPVYHKQFPSNNFWSSGFKSKETRYISYTKDYIKTPHYYIPSNKKLGLFELRLPYGYAYGATLARKQSAPMMQTDMAENVLTESIVAEEESMENDFVESAIEEFVKPTIRTNFNETAFFFPQLYTDKEGNIQLEFTIPQSLTKWKFQALAHTKDLYVGLYETTVTTEQDLMIQLNMPRFIRQSDVLNLTANLTNLSEKKLQAIVQLTCINPKTDEVVLLNDTTAIDINIEAGATLPISWKLEGFDELDLLTCKVTATSGEFSDGEQHYLVVLPDKVPVMESYPISIKGDKSHSFNFKDIANLIDDVDTKNIRLEFTANPVWYAIQALPALSTPSHENAIDYFTAYYVNSLAGKIIADNPKIKAIFEQWQVGKTSNLRSALLQNEEFQQLLIEEAPWLEAAENETDRQARIALLFDINQQSQQKKIWLEKLQTLQLENGAFTWFYGMRESRWVTQNILEGLLRLHQFNKDDTHQEIIEKAVSYLDGQINKDYLHIKNHIKDYQKRQTINSIQLQYLAVRSQLLDITINDEIIEAYVYFLDQAEKYYPKFGLYDKALATISLHYNDNELARNRVLQSIKEHASYSDEMGMYWVQNKSGYSWNQRPVSVQVKIMEAFSLSDTYKADLEEMKVWLLRQKQTQMWDSPVASVDAIYALTNIGYNRLQEVEHYTISTSKQNVSSSKGTSGLGYLQLPISTEEIKEEISIESIKSSETNISYESRAWGSIYWMYYQDMDKVRSSGDALQISKQLFIEKTEANKQYMVPLNDAKGKNNPQKVKKGDKLIVRLVVEVDRDLEFVSIKDSRSANLEPLKQISATEWRENLIYYRSIKDASTNYFFNHLPKGVYVFEDEYYVNNSGEFSGGITEIQCMYAPEFKGIGSGERIKVE